MAEPIRLQKFFTDSGVLSRRAAEAEILIGNVLVNGVPAKLGDRVDPERDEVTYKGRRVLPRADKPHRYLLLNKPRGYVTTVHDEKGRRNVTDLVRGAGTRLYPVGRLDMDSEGLLLMSNDGDLVNRLTHPRYEHRKTYLVRVAGRWSAEKLALLRSPITLDDGYTIRPVPVEVVKEWENNTRLLKFTLGEGRKRQIRKMCSAAHLVVLSLKRVAVGGFELPKDLESGQWRDLTEAEINSLRV